jgi:predicted dehydrogenase
VVEIVDPFHLTRVPNKRDMTMDRPFDRRDFLRLGSAAAMATQLGGPVMAEDNSRSLRVGVIGVGGRGTYLLRQALAAGAEVPALCDINLTHLDRATQIVVKTRDGRKPAGYSQGPYDYRRMLQRDDLEAVIIGTPMQVHAPMAIDALRAGKHALSEVAAAMTLDDCWGLVRAAEETGKIYMLAENCCYMDYVMMISRMVQCGVFGPITYAECGYVHAVPSMLFDPRGNLTWRGEMVRDFAGNNYPTHSFGPVAQWLGINRGDRMVSLVAGATGQTALRRYIEKNLPAGHAAHKIQFKGADSVTALIHTEKGALVDLRYDIVSPRPVISTTYYSLQGLKASYESRIDSLWIEGRSKGHQWEPRSTYAKEYEHPLWTTSRKEATGSGHGGCDFFVFREFFKAIRNGGPSPIDAYDAAAWSSIIPLTAQSISEGGRVLKVPDFTKGKWESRKQV